MLKRPGVVEAQVCEGSGGGRSQQAGTRLPFPIRIDQVCLGAKRPRRLSFDKSPDNPRDGAGCHVPPSGSLAQLCRSGNPSSGF
jgi:hypothetical protein